MGIPLESLVGKVLEAKTKELLPKIMEIIDSLTVKDPAAVASSSSAHDADDHPPLGPQQSSGTVDQMSLAVSDRGNLPLPIDIPGMSAPKRRVTETSSHRPKPKTMGDGKRVPPAGESKKAPPPTPPLPGDGKKATPLAPPLQGDGKKAPPLPGDVKKAPPPPTVKSVGDRASKGEAGKLKDRSKGEPPLMDDRDRHFKAPVKDKMADGIGDEGKDRTGSSGKPSHPNSGLEDIRHDVQGSDKQDSGAGKISELAEKEESEDCVSTEVSAPQKKLAKRDVVESSTKEQCDGSGRVNKESTLKEQRERRDHTEQHKSKKEQREKQDQKDRMDHKEKKEHKDHTEQTKDKKEQKTHSDINDPKKKKEHELKEWKEKKESKEKKELNEQKDYTEMTESKDRKEQELKERDEYSGHTELKEPKERKDIKEKKDHIESNDPKGKKEPGLKDRKERKEKKEHKERTEHTGMKELKEKKELESIAEQKKKKEHIDHMVPGESRERKEVKDAKDESMSKDLKERKERYKDDREQEEGDEEEQKESKVQAKERKKENKEKKGQKDCKKQVEHKAHNECYEGKAPNLQIGRNDQNEVVAHKEPKDHKEPRPEPMADVENHEVTTNEEETKPTGDQVEEKDKELIPRRRSSRLLSLSETSEGKASIDGEPRNVQENCSVDTKKGGHKSKGKHCLQSSSPDSTIIEGNDGYGSDTRGQEEEGDGVECRGDRRGSDVKRQANKRTVSQDLEEQAKRHKAARQPSAAQERPKPSPVVVTRYNRQVKRNRRYSHSSECGADEFPVVIDSELQMEEMEDKPPKRSRNSSKR